jgi:glycosyltransferase involved in cell wall biosynthesis
LLSSEAHAQLPCWHLLVAGGGDSCGLQVLARDLGIAQAVEFLGWLNRTAATEVLLHANALVLPSHHEALPLVLLEAASLGVPSVSTRVGAVPDIFTDGHDVLMVPPGDPAMLAETLARIMLDQGLAARIGHNARCLYHREFTMTAFVSRMAAVYRQFSGPGP